MNSRYATISTAILISIVLSGCAFQEVKIQQEKLSAFCSISGDVKTAYKSENPLVVLLGRKVGSDPEKRESWEIFDHYVLERGGRWIFYTGPGVYGLAAFEDVNKDLIYQLDEPIMRVSFDDLIRCEKSSRKTKIALTIPKSGRLRLNSPLDVAKLQVRDIHDQVNVSVGMLIKMGEIVNLDDPRFDQKNAKTGHWRPFDFLFEVGAGIYFLQAYDPGKIPVLFVHGIDGSPRNFASIIEKLDRTKLQPWVFYYPSGISLSIIASHLNQTVEKLRLRLGFEKFFVVAHSMGGLVSRSFMFERRTIKRSRDVPVFVTIATPWAGHKAAAAGVKFAPAVVQSWYDIDPGSEYLRELFYTGKNTPPTLNPLPSGISHHLIFAFKRNSAHVGESGDQVVSVSSQMRWEAQRDASRIYGFDATHTGILKRSEVTELVNKLLTEGR